MDVLQERLEDRYDVVARARGLGRKDQPYKRVLKVFKYEGDFVVLELDRDEESEGWLVSATTEATADRGAGYGAEYFENYSDALGCFNKICEKYGIDDYNGSDFGSD